MSFNLSPPVSSPPGFAEDFESAGAHGSVSPNSKDAIGSDALLQHSHEQQAEFPSNSNLFSYEHDINGNGGNPGKKRNGEPLRYRCVVRPAGGSECSPVFVDSNKRRMTRSGIPAHVESPPQTAKEKLEHYKAHLETFLDQHTHQYLPQTQYNGSTRTGKTTRHLDSTGLST
ncbi:uncharacterized protein K444DRAFT_629632 [Hyaloscypha bicolor E]|uniref:Uncharacterized protein n=1 Tax=Hyaloscypha bicolor E TaxID=1095630 RepID=A0A2J6TB80_9HELO|nr:uncharacterized protein K444DRAFT_629632 [Hyaloscypha bicolor E]PMD60232.1 hypothetical protein K444DRAFT_629632 [Hyaloscypha bicolor E]